jgi:hypothetical protein
MDKTRVWSPIETEDEIRSRLVDPMATTETVALCRDLKTSARRRTLIVQQDLISCISLIKTTTTGAIG